MEKFLSDYRKLTFLGAALLALSSWGSGFANWSDMFTTSAIFGLVGIMGSLLLSNVTSNIFKPSPVITVTTEPEKQTVVTTTTTTPPPQAGGKP